MAKHKITVLVGVHCGPEVRIWVWEIICAAVWMKNYYRLGQVLKTIEENKPIVDKPKLREHLMGGLTFADPSASLKRSIDATSSPLADETLAATDTVLLGSIAGPEWGTGAVRPESLDKANVLATSRLWCKVMTGTFEKEFPDLEVEHQLIGSTIMIMIKNLIGLNGAVVTSNLFSDIFTDELERYSDGKGKCNGIYEHIHGSAPDISGKGIVNPIPTTLSVAMLLRYSLNLPEEAKA
ncbi:3-isopropylmalate dehydrogenase [Fusarium sp. LHS14.1]|nr:3-isopropylmalate dehydrogenase [Fusarium sp. LHS14.1]